jgi:hypothetical protein
MQLLSTCRLQPKTLFYAFMRIHSISIQPDIKPGINANSMTVNVNSEMYFQS